MTDLQLNLLGDAEFPELASALRSCAPKALARWESVVCEVLPKADELTFTQLRDDMPQVLKRVAETLEQKGTRLDKLLNATACHADVRFDQRYNLSELLIEYDLLRPILIEEVTRELSRPLEISEVVALDLRIGMCAREGILAFVEHQSRELKSANEAQSKYLSFLSHDLRGGLNGVFLMIEVLRRELQGETRLAQTMGDLEAMRRSLLETIGTMDRFLNAERFRKGKVQVQSAELSVQTLLSETVAHFAYQAREKGVKLTVAPTETVRIVSDRELLSMILQNFLSNAIKYSKAGEIRVEGKLQENGAYLISVQDQGPGIAADQLSRMFAPFSRGETHGETGVGLGLFIAREAADLLRAKIWAESSVGAGSTFFLEIGKPD